MMFSPQGKGVVTFGKGEKREQGLAPGREVV